MRIVQPHSDHLYVLQSSCGWIKIGRAADVGRRIKELLCGCPPSITLTVLMVAYGMGPEESPMHDALDEFRDRGEWFSPVAAKIITDLLERFSPSEVIRYVMLNFTGKPRVRQRRSKTRWVDKWRADRRTAKMAARARES